ncbi:MAG: DsbA family protein [Taibaiella sp.]|nr:DsbA family protein [Taibaiella sp.]
MEQNMGNPLLCDIETGLCEVHNTIDTNHDIHVEQDIKALKVIYYTDPICSSCWGIEPQLRKLKLEYGEALDIEYRMGGLLPDWSYNSGGISKPSDVAHHWDEVSVYYDMPIDGDVWLEDPLSSSYPPSIAFKAAQLQDSHKALLFLREIREMVFLQKKNITKWAHINIAAGKAGLDTLKLKADYEGSAKDLFATDLELARELGVRGFPTMFFADSSGKREIVYGSKPYSVYEAAIVKLHPQVIKHTYNTDWRSLFMLYPTLTSREYAEISGTPRNEADIFLQKLCYEDWLEKLETKNGILWKLKK